jgi:two-component system, cell cycle response regulator
MAFALSAAEDAMALAATKHGSYLETRLEELERRNQLLEAENERLRVYKDYAYTDALTEFPNRRLYYGRLLQEVARARRGPHSLTLALVDLDLFKQINEEVGHRGGDQVLKFFSQFIRVNLRQEDVLCRIGGDEFAIIMPDTTPDRAAVFFDRVRKKLDQVELSIDGRPPLTLSFSCGLARFKPEYLPEDLIEEADHSLYSAKARGRNRVVAAETTEAMVSRAVH